MEDADHGVDDGMMAELRRRDPALFWAAALMAAGAAACIVLMPFDSRQILGINPWIKPFKFYISIAIFLASVGWYMADTHPVAGARRAVRWTAITTMTVEMICITMQVVRGRTSHFNNDTAFDAMVFSLMGMAITINTLAILLFLAIVRRDTPPGRAGYLWGIRLGIVLFVLGSLQGFTIVVNQAHSVPGPDGGPGLPFVNWALDRGDLRIAHFVGLHGLQAVPLIGFVLDRLTALARAQRVSLTVATAVLWLTAMAALLAWALSGRPLLWR